MNSSNNNNNDSSFVRMKYRFIRLNPYYCIDETLQLIRQEMNEWIITTHQHDQKVIIDDEKVNNNSNDTNDDKETNTTRITEANISSSSSYNNHNNVNERVIKMNEYPIEVSWLKDSQLYFYAIPYNYPMAQLSKCYHIGRYYGQDVSSGAAIAVLLTSIYDNNYNHHNQNDNIDNNDDEHDNNHCSSNDVAASSTASHSNHINNQVINHNNYDNIVQTTTEKLKNHQYCQDSLDSKLENYHHDNDNDDYNKYWRVLDLCCAPGLKLCCIADFLRYNNTNHNVIKTEQQQQYVSGTIQQHKYEQFGLNLDQKDIVVTSDDNNNNNSSINNEHHHKHDIIGVDISNDRLSISKNIVRKYQIHNNCIENDDITKKYMIQNDDNNQNNDKNNDKSNNNNVNIRLYCNDGTTFGQLNDNNVIIEPLNLVFDLHTSQQQNEIQQLKNNKRKRMNKSARSREHQLLKQLSNIDQQQQCCQLNNIIKDNDNNEDNMQTSMKLFDRVLVDAECSTDASMKHSSKRLLSLSNNNKKKQKNVAACHEKNEEEIECKDDDGSTTSDRYSSEMKIITSQQQVQKQHCDDDDNDTYIQNLITLQKKLIQSGFLLLKSNGIMVYSTCSLSYQQNEYIVDWLLKQYPNTASLIPVTFSNINNNNNQISVQNSFIQEGSIKGTVRFLPNVIYNNDKTTVSTSLFDCCSSKDRDICGSTTATSANNDHIDTHIHDLYGDGFFLAKIRKK